LSAELGAFSDVVSTEEPAADGDEVDAEVWSFDDVLAADSADEPDVVDDDESRDELEELASVGSATAIPGAAATAPPTPSANARTLARTRCCTSTGTAPKGCAAQRPASLAS
jgi:hypothetical protein